MTDLTQIFPVPQQLTINGQVISITPFKLGEIPKVFKVIDPITKLILSALTSSENQMESLAKIMVQGGENILDLLALGTRQPRTWIDDLETDQGVQLLIKVLEVNSSFFVQRVLPLITQATIKVPNGQV